MTGDVQDKFPVQQRYGSRRTFLPKSTDYRCWSIRKKRSLLAGSFESLAGLMMIVTLCDVSGTTISGFI